MKLLFCSLFLALTLCNCEPAADRFKIAGTTPPAAKKVPPPPQLPPAEKKRYHDLVAEFINKHLPEHRHNGGVLIAKNGVIVYERYSGFANMRSKDSMHAEVPMQVASTGKTMTAAAVLMLIQNGKIGLNDPVTKYFPQLPYPEVTVKMLLNHRSGLPEYYHYMEKMGWDRKVKATNADVIRTLTEWKPGKAFNPDSRYSYCNTNFVILASIVEQVSGKPFPQFMKEQLFDPLEMHHSFVLKPQDSAHVVYSYQANGAPWTLDFSDGPYGDKNIYTTPRDLLKWDQALYSGTILNKSLLDSAYTPYSNEKPGVKNYGLGWHLLMLPNGKKVPFHNGRWHGFTAAFARLTDEKVTIIMTSNKMNMALYPVAKKMYNLFGPYGGKEEEKETE